MVKPIHILIVVILALLLFLRYQNGTINELEGNIKVLEYEHDKQLYMLNREKLDSIVYIFQTDTITTTKIITKYEKKSDSIISLGDSAVHSFISSYLNAYTSR